MQICLLLEGSVNNTVDLSDDYKQVPVAGNNNKINSQGGWPQTTALT